MSQTYGGPTDYGYQTIREFLASDDGWNGVALYDESGNVVTEITIHADDRAEWTHYAGDQTMRVRIEINGTDSDIPTPVRLVGAQSLHNGQAVSGVREWANDKEMTEESRLIVTHQIQVPKIS